MNASSQPKQAPVELRAPKMDLGLDLDPLTKLAQNSGFLEYLWYRFDVPPPSLGVKQQKHQLYRWVLSSAWAASSSCIHNKYANNTDI